MQIDRLTAVGLGIVGLGWVVLVADMTVSEAMLRAGNLVAVISLRSDIVTIAQTAILSGFGLSLIGALRSGFGTLNGFFESVLQRSTSPRSTPATAYDDDETADLQVPVPMTHPAAPSPAAGVYATPAERAVTSGQIRPVPAAYQAASERAMPTGQIKDRNYVILADGSVEVETLLGTRIFASLDEARDFIR